jgi:glycosyltransferase involved in cell wall biosynthesis
MERNLWFEKEAIHLLEAFLKTSKREPQVLFAYSYAALGIIKWAKKRGWKTILGQIDPGIEEENIVAKLADKHRVLAPDWRRIDGDYWERWKEECAAADRIMVNSSWSKELVERSGVDGKKIDVVPLAYDRGTEESHKSYPHQFESSRPLRVLFLGQVSLRKGIAEVLEAARILRGKPIEFQIVGPVQIDLEAAGKMGWDSMQVKFIGTVPRSEVNRYYEQADLFLFPTHSDGFGLTQLEAQRRRLPLLVSRYCGEVVKNGVNGFILKEVTGEAIAKSLMQLLDQPELLSQCSQSSGVDASFSADSVAEKILNLA